MPAKRSVQLPFAGLTKRIASNARARFCGVSCTLGSYINHIRRERGYQKLCARAPRRIAAILYCIELIAQLQPQIVRV